MSKVENNNTTRAISMNHRKIAFAALLACCGTAFAQSTVTLYGVVDAACLSSLFDMDLY